MTDGCLYLFAILPVFHDANAENLYLVALVAGYCYLDNIKHYLKQYIYVYVVWYLGQECLNKPL